MGKREEERTNTITTAGGGGNDVDEEGSRARQQQHQYQHDGDEAIGEESTMTMASPPPPLLTLNHVSRLCRCVKESIEFYTNVLGFVLIERPPAFDFDGAWLFNYGIGIHLVQSRDETRLPPDKDHLDPMDNHISFQCEDMGALEKKLKENQVKYMKRTVEDDQIGAEIDQLFFNDPDGFMIEICNCENLELVPAGPAGNIRLPVDRHNPPLKLQNSTTNA